METYQRIIVALDNTAFDKKLLHYFDHFCEISNPKHLYFVFVDKNLEAPADLDILYKGLDGKSIPKDELMARVLKNRVEESFGSRHGQEVDINVLEGSPLEALLHWEKVKHADLLVLGNKKRSEGSGVSAKRIARNSTASVLFVPEASRSQIKKILVPIDFSENSKRALEGAISMASDLPKAEVTCFNAFDVPLSGYPTINLSYEKFIRSMSAFKQEAFDNYIGKFDLQGVKVHTDYVENDPDNPAKHIHEYARKHHFDLIVMSSKRHDLLERVVMGSVTEKLLSLEKKIPILVLR